MGGIGISYRVSVGQRIKAWSYLFLVALAFGCREKNEQILVEHDTASFIAKVIGFYERRFPNAPVTNLQVVFQATGTPYPVRFDQQLRGFGRFAGFTNSLFEKYILAPAPFTNVSVTGKVVLLNAEPFPERSGKPGRIIVSKSDAVDTGWIVQWFPEEQVQQILRVSGEDVPKPVPVNEPVVLPKVQKPRLFARIENYFIGVSRAWGLGTGFGHVLVYAIFGTAGLLLIISAGLLVRGRPNRTK